MEASPKIQELNFICNHVLTKLGELKPQLSAEITRMTKGGRYKDLRPLQKKLEKIRIFIAKDPVLFEGIIKDLNFSEYKGPVSATNFFSIMEKMLPSLHYNGEMTGGNYRGL